MVKDNSGSEDRRLKCSMLAVESVWLIDSLHCLKTTTTFPAREMKNELSKERNSYSIDRIMLCLSPVQQLCLVLTVGTFIGVALRIACHESDVVARLRFQVERDQAVVNEIVQGIEVLFTNIVCRRWNVEE